MIFGINESVEKTFEIVAQLAVSKTQG